VAAGVIRASLPFQDRLRRLKRKFRPYTANPANSGLALHQGLQQVQLLRDAGANLSGTIMELGSGWLPIVPMLFHLAGARRLILTDVTKLLDDHTIGEAARMIGNNIDRVAATLEVPADALRARLAQKFRPDYHVPWQPSDIASGSVDALISRTTLEHIPAVLLESYMPEFGRMLRPDGLMCHIIDNSDHWQHHDATLSRLNFLRYEDGPLWRLMCRRRYQNRLRHSDYLALFQRHGWTPLVVEASPDPQSLQDLETMRLASGFAGRDHQDLAILTSTLVLRRM
jgi:SAM-dependent methyltransferase